MSIQGSTPEGRRWLRRRGLVALAGFAVAFAIAAVPAGATFTDVPPSNPFYNDINAIQGAGITGGCGGGNFCPTAFIQRQGEAAFIHRGLGRMSGDTTISDTTISPSGSFATDTTVDADFISIGGQSGGTQFVTVEATMSIFYSAGTPPATVQFYLTDSTGLTNCTGPRSPLFAEDITTGNNITDNLSWTLAVPSNTGRTFRLCAFTGGDDVVGVLAVSMSLSTAPFGSTGANVLGDGAQPQGPGGSHPPLGD